MPRSYRLPGRMAVKSATVLLRDHFPFTLQGLTVLLLALIALDRFGYQRMDLVVFALAICALAITGFCLLAVIMAGLLLRRRLRQPETLPQITAEAGYPNETGYRMPALSWLPLITLDWKVVFPDAIDTRRHLDTISEHWEESIVPQRRCLTTTIRRRYTVSDVLGFCRFSWTLSQDQPLMALPQTGHVRNLPLLRSLTAEDGISSPAGSPQGDRMDIRPYAPGDAVRNIMWGVYARTRHLNVRLAERSVHHSNRTLAYLLSGPDDEAAAAVARIAVESGALGDDWVFGADGSSETTSEVAAALRLIAGSRPLGQPYRNGLDDFLRQVGARNTHCIVFASATTGAWVDALRASVMHSGGRFSIVLATDGIDQEYTPPWWHRLVFRRQPEEAAKAAVPQLSRLLQELAQFTASSLIVDRHTGRSFDQRFQRL